MLLLIAIICLFVACISVAVGICFVKRNKFVYLILHTSLLILLIVLGLLCITHQETFSGYSILLILSILPLFLTLFDNYETKFKTEDFSNGQDFENDKELDENNKNVVTFKYFCNLAKGIGYTLSALALSFCALYLGKETVFGVLLAFAIGLTLTFLSLIIKKNFSFKSIKKFLLKFCEQFSYFFAIGLLFASVMLAFLYSFSIQNILFALGALSYIVHICLEMKFKNSRYNHLIYLFSTLLLFATFFF